MTHGEGGGVAAVPPKCYTNKYFTSNMEMLLGDRCLYSYTFPHNVPDTVNRQQAGDI